MGSRRREERIQSKLPVRVWGMDANGKPFTVTAKTLDITRYGARLIDVPYPLAPGDIVGVQHGTDKGRFRVAWCGKPGTSQCGHIGLQSLDPTKPIWGEELKKPAVAVPTASVAPQLIDAGFEQIPLAGDLNSKRATASDTYGFSLISRPDSAGEQKRVARRFPCGGHVEIYDRSTGGSFTGTLADISLTGCYIKTTSPLPARTDVDLKIRVSGMELKPIAQVRASHPALGMGLQFVTIGSDDQYRLSALVQQLATHAESNTVELEPNRRRSQASDALSSVIYNVAAQVRELEKIASSADITVDKRLLSRFRAHMEQAKQTAWDVQEYLESHDQLRDPAPLLAKIETKRLKAAAAALRELLADLDAETLTLEREGANEVLTAAVQLYRRLAAMAEKRKAATATR